MHLLAGQSFVKEVDDAISNKTFRFLAILSKNSLNKENPTNERTKAIAVGKRLAIDDFVITLNLDGLSSDEIPWTLSQKSYASFHPSWADGLNQLIKALEGRNAPCAPSVGRNLVCQWTSQRDQPAIKNERIWTNLIQVKSFPVGLRQYEVKDPNSLETLKYSAWPIAVQSSNFVWSFTEPPPDLAALVDYQRVTSWLDQHGHHGNKIKNFARYLLRRGIEDYCLSQGMIRSEDGKSIYFPTGLLEKDKHFYVGLYGKRTHLKFVGKSTFRVGFGKTEVNRHHLSPSFRLIECENNQFQIQIFNRVFLTNEDGTPLHPSRMNRRRKKICKNWWNDKWGARLLAFASWMSDNQEEVEIFKTPNGSFILSGKPLSLNCAYGINDGLSNESELIEEYPENAIDDTESSDTISDYGIDGSEATDL